MTYVSLFAGVGGFDLGFDAAGFRCLAQVEIDRQCRSVLALRWPDVPRYDDVRSFGREQVPTCDIVVGGFPCQDLSVAGNRGGLEGKRSGLFYELARVCFELRPRFLVWENVGGLLSSDGGRDLARILRHLGDGGFFGAWRVLDARHFGVPQSRRRVFGVFARGRSGAERCAEVLALREGGTRRTPARRKAGKGVAATLTRGSGSAGVNPPGRRQEDAPTSSSVPCKAAGSGATALTPKQRRAGNSSSAAATPKVSAASAPRSRPKAAPAAATSTQRTLF